MNHNKELIDELKQTMIFRISERRSDNVEAEQQNFLAWLAEEHPEAVALWLREVLAVFTETVVRVRRDAFDSLLLFLDFENEGPVVVVKHCTETLINPEELQYLVDKAREIYGTRAQFLLFTLRDPAPFMALYYPWSVCRFDYYAETLQTVRTRRYTPSDHDHAARLSKYIFTLRLYSTIHRIAIGANIGVDTSFLGSLTQFDPMKDSGFDIFATSVLYEQLLHGVCKQLSIPLYEVLSSDKRSVGAIRGYFRGGSVSWKPLVGLECVIRADEGSESMCLGVQVEGNQFRLYAAQQRGGAELEQFATALRAENRWFTFRETPELQALERLWGRKNHEDAQTKDFCGYSQNGIKNFAYCYKLFADAVNADDIINAVVLYIQFAQRTFTE